ncbi:HD domain-containing protein [bacterium]|nr:HD domain-containing protein [bacterium]
MEEDHVTTTALLEHRLLCGSRAIFEEFQRRFFDALSGPRLERFLEAKLRELDERWRRFGYAINVAQPDLKLSPGGLREYHFALWVALARYRAPGLEPLVERGVLYRGQLADYERALDFILRMRHELHFCARRPTDQLVYEWHEPVAQGLGYRDEGHVLAEERMMRNYFRAAHHLYSLSQVVASHCRHAESERTTVVCRDPRVPEGTVIAGREVMLPDRFWNLQSSPMRLFDFLEFMHDHPDLALSGVSRFRASEAVAGFDSTLRLRSPVGQRFLALLSPPVGAGRSLRLMQELGLLERLMPAWKRVRNLVRKDLYHHYAVDEHLLLAVELLENIPEAAGPEEARLARLWKAVPRRDLLRLAVLLHDVGKGSGKDHSLEGAFVAERFARALGLSQPESALVKWLVENHLLMGELIRSADLSSHDVLVEFARKVKSQDSLDLLYLLTYVDIRAVAPGMMTAWKLSQLDRLYRNATELLSAEQVPSRQETRGRRIQGLLENLPEGVELEVLHKHLANLPKDYALYTSPALVARHIHAVSQHAPGSPVVRFSGNGHTEPLEIIVVTEDRIGLFYLLCSACLSENLSIHDARLDHYDDNLILDTLYCFARPEGTVMEGNGWHWWKRRYGATWRARSCPWCNDRRPSRPWENGACASSSAWACACETTSRATSPCWRCAPWTAWVSCRPSRAPWSNSTATSASPASTPRAFAPRTRSISPTARAGALRTPPA